jgi:hypothetical protein
VAVAYAWLPACFLVNYQQCKDVAEGLKARIQWLQMKYLLSNFTLSYGKYQSFLLQIELI